MPETKLHYESITWKPMQSVISLRNQINHTFSLNFISFALVFINCLKDFVVKAFDLKIVVNRWECRTPSLVGNCA